MFHGAQEHRHAIQMALVNISLVFVLVFNFPSLGGLGIAEPEKTALRLVSLRNTAFWPLSAAEL